MINRPGTLALILVSITAGCQQLGAPASGTRGLGSGDGATEQGAAIDSKPADMPLADMTADIAPGCGEVSSHGCCDGETLWFCHNQVLTSVSCKGKPLCGWNAAGYYDCNTSGTIDPSGKALKICRAFLPDGALPPTDGPPGDLTAACGQIGSHGCCKGNVLFYCKGQTLQVLDCALNPSCGWNDTGQFYDCGNDGKSSPLGWPKACPASVVSDASFDTSRGDGDVGLAGDLDGSSDMGDSDSGDGGCACSITGSGGPSWPWALPILCFLISRASVSRDRRRRGENLASS